MRKGFTLMELLAVVLIIAVLTAMALPYYQNAMNEARFSTMASTLKSIKDSQEIFLLQEGFYTDNYRKLTTQVSNATITGNVAKTKDGKTYTLNTGTSYECVRGEIDGINNRYVFYFAQSENYPSEVHCEAVPNDPKSESLCDSMGGEYLGMQDGYKVYVLNGEGQAQ